MKAKSTFRLVLFVLTLWTCNFAATAQVEYQPEMEKFLGDWIWNSDFIDGGNDRIMIRIKKRGDFVSLSLKTYYVDKFGERGEPHHRIIENLSFDGSLFRWDLHGDEGYYCTLRYNKGTLVFEDKCYNDRERSRTPPAIFMPYDSDW